MCAKQSIDYFKNITNIKNIVGYFKADCVEQCHYRNFKRDATLLQKKTKNPKTK